MLLPSEFVLTDRALQNDGLGYWPTPDYYRCHSIFLLPNIIVVCDLVVLMGAKYR